MPADIQGIIIHRCESGTTGDEVRAKELEHGFGYHYFIGATGIVYQLYPDTSTPWHARKWSHLALGIAVFGDFHPPDKSRFAYPTPAQWTALVNLCQRLIDKYGVLFVMGHTDLADSTTVPDKVCPGANLDIRKLRISARQPMDSKQPQQAIQVHSSMAD